MSKGKRRKGKVPFAERPGDQSSVPKQGRPSDKPLLFSFKHLDLGNAKFSLDGCGEVYLATLLDRLRSLGGWTAREFMRSRSPSLRSHAIDFNGTSEGGFPLKEEVVGTPWQFCLSANEHGRVHGHLIDNVFYVVWIDREHNLYP